MFNATNTSHDTQSPRFEIDHAPLEQHASRNQQPAIVENQSPDWEQFEEFTAPDLVEPVVAQPIAAPRAGMIPSQVSSSSICL